VVTGKTYKDIAILTHGKNVYMITDYVLWIEDGTGVKYIIYSQGNTVKSLDKAKKLVLEEYQKNHEV